jgi:hypothetical protein
MAASSARSTAKARRRTIGSLENVSGFIELALGHTKSITENPQPTQATLPQSANTKTDFCMHA